MNIPFLTDIRFTWLDLADLVLVTAILYAIIVRARQTRSIAAIDGLITIILVYLLSRYAGLNTLHWMLENIVNSLVLIVVIVFQRDIRHALNSIGPRNWWLPKFFRKKEPDPALQIICEAAAYMAHRKIGALIVLERNMPLGDTTDRGVRLDARISKDLLIALFWPNSPLHDGAALIRGSTIVAGGCILPLSTAVAKRDFGTRHRAALGITEETDAVVVTVSEERGVAAVAVGGRLTGALDEQKLYRVLAAAMERNL